MFCGHCGAQNPDDGRFCGKCRSVLPVVGGNATIPPSSTPAPRNAANLGPGSPAGARTGAFAGRYELLSILGKGGMGVVYRAKDLELEEEIAIKLLQSQFTTDPEEVARFKREITTARKITHPNVIRIHDFGVAAPGPGSAGGEVFISMELLTGGTLAEKMTAAAKSGSHLPFDEALGIGAQIAEGLAAAHENGVIHRDIKPQNVIFSGSGRPKLVDFGIARLATATSRTIGYAGTPHYMSPEQAQSKPVTAASDLYSLGVMLFELVTGSLPFQGDSLVSLALAHANEPPPSPSARRAGVPPPVESLILRTLAKNPADRPGSATELAEQMRALAGPLKERSAGSGTMPAIAAPRPTVPPASVAAAAPAPVVTPPPGLADSQKFATPAVVVKPPERPSVPPPVGDASLRDPLASLSTPPKKKSSGTSTLIIGLMILFGAGALLLIGVVIIGLLNASQTESPPETFSIPTFTPIAIGSYPFPAGIGLGSPIPMGTYSFPAGIGLGSPIRMPATPAPQKTLNVKWSSPAGWTAEHDSDPGMETLISPSHPGAILVVIDEPGDGVEGDTPMDRAREMLSRDYVEFDDETVGVSSGPAEESIAGRMWVRFPVTNGMRVGTSFSTPIGARIIVLLALVDAAHLADRSAVERDLRSLAGTIH